MSRMTDKQRKIITKHFQYWLDNALQPVTGYFDFSKFFDDIRSSDAKLNKMLEDAQIDVIKQSDNLTPSWIFKH